MALLALVLLAVSLAEYGRIGWLWWHPVAETVVLAVIVVTAAYGLGYGAGPAWLTVIVGLWWASSRSVRSWEVPGMIAAGIAAVLALIASPWLERDTPPLMHWYSSLDVPGFATVSLDEFALTIATGLFLLAPANAVVRVVLDRVAGGLMAQEKALKGGRILGPLERLFMFGLAIGGNFAGVAAIVAAKGILRFPEISRDDDQGSRAEYVLVGSFVSWALAFAIVPLF